VTSQILSQDEVDALLQGISSESDAPAAPAEPTTGVRAYDLSGQERIVRGRMPNLEIVNERFARNLRNGLFQLLRKNAEISTGEIKVDKYSVFLREIAVPTSLNLVSVKPLRGNGLVVCDPALVFAAVDSLFGGNGKHRTRIEGRDFSPTEQRVIRRLVDVVTGEYARAWAATYPLELAYLRSEMLPQFATIATPSEVVVSTSFEMEIGDMSGSVHICIPYATLEPIRDVLFSQVQIDNGAEDGRWVSLMKDQIREAQVELVVELAHAPATVEQLLGMAPGDFIELDLQRGVQAKVAGVPILACAYGISNGKYALKVDQLLASSSMGWIGEHHA
jgi:flagellar motor switch protein FliM